MPELPEVNTFQRYFDYTSVGRTIAAVEVHDGKILRNVSPEAFREQLAGRAICGSYRQGKYLFALLDNGHSVLLHFGMTGDLVYYNDPADRPRFERFAWGFDNGFTLGFDCPRKFARILYLEDHLAYLDDLGLGPDALRVSQHDFLLLASGKQSMLKGFLMNQRYLAGVGNLYADEICYQANVHPASRLNKVPEETLRLIHQKMQDILQYAVDREAYYKKYPEDWLWQWRKEGHPGPGGQGEIEKAKIAGRSTYFCAATQVLYV